jgi:hypothetical protein
VRKNLLITKDKYGADKFDKTRILIAKYSTEGEQIWTLQPQGSHVSDIVRDSQNFYHISTPHYSFIDGSSVVDILTVTIPDRLSLVLDQAKSLVSAADASAIANQLPLLAEIGSRLLNRQGSPLEAAYNSVYKHLDNLWGGLFSRLGQIHTTASDILATAQEFKSFLSNAETSFEQLAFVTKLLYGVAKTPELADNLDNLNFVSALIDLGKTYAAVKSDTNALNSPFDFLFNVWRAKSEVDLGIAAAEFQTLLQKESFYSLISSHNGNLPAISQSFSIPAEDATSLIQALQNSDYSHSLLSSYHVWNVYAAERNPTEEMILVSTWDNSVGNNAFYRIGDRLQQVDGTGRIYPYILVVRGDELTYYPQGHAVPLHPGDRVLVPLPGTSNLPLPLIESYLADQVIEPLLAANQTIGQFVLGAVYQFSLNQSEPFRNLISLDPSVQQLLENTEQSAEAVLPDTVAFEAGRLFGDGAAIVAGIIEILVGISIGGGGTGAGGLLALTGGGAVPGAAIAAVSVAVGSGLVLQGAGSVEAGVEGIFERTGTLLAIIEGGGEGASDDVMREAERRRARSDFDSRIRQAEAEGNQDLADDIRYERYLHEKEFEGGKPLSKEEWLEATNRLRENSRLGFEAEQTVLDEIGVQNNNRLSGSDRVFYTDEQYGATIPDAVTDTAWIDVKSINRNSTTFGNSDEVFVQYDTEQMRAQRRGAMQDKGKEHVVVLTGDDASRLRPSRPLADESLVL